MRWARRADGVTGARKLFVRSRKWPDCPWQVCACPDVPTAGRPTLGLLCGPACMGPHTARTAVRLPLPHAPVCWLQTPVLWKGLKRERLTVLQRALCYVLHGYVLRLPCAHGRP